MKTDIFSVEMSESFKKNYREIAKALLTSAVVFLVMVAPANPASAQISEDENGKIVLDQKVLWPKCRPGARSKSGSSSESFVVKAQTQLKYRSGREYKYTAEYGKLVVNGSKAEWDLTGEPSGTYRLSVAVMKDGQVEVQYDATVKIEDSDCNFLCECPVLTVRASSETVKNGETLTFHVLYAGVDTVSYTWTVKNGEIVEGQGTAEIKVRARRNAALNAVTATVSIGGLDPDCHCMTEASASATIIL